MSSMRDRLAAKTANLRSTTDIQAEEVRRVEKPKTGPGMVGALAAAQARIQELEAGRSQSEIPVASITANPWQPRKVFDSAELEELAQSIREVGLIQPIVVRRVPSLSGDSFQLIAGERRLRAHRLLGKEAVRAVIHDVSDEDMLVLALVENISREELSDYEISKSLRQAESEFPSRKRMAEALGMSRSGLYRFLAFDKLPDFIVQDLELRPRLLGSAAAEALAGVLQRHGDKALRAARELWPLLLAGEMDQGKFGAAIDALVTRRASSAHTRKRSIEKFFAGKTHAGSITKDVNGFTLKIKAEALTDVHEEQLRELIGRLFPTRPH